LAESAVLTQIHDRSGKKQVRMRRGQLLIIIIIILIGLSLSLPPVGRVKAGGKKRESPESREAEMASRMPLLWVN
jgi:hypothetical protein